MNISLAPSNMYGHWKHVNPHICEFQNGVTMIYVSYDEYHPMVEQLENAEKTINQAFLEIPIVLKFAENIQTINYQKIFRNAKEINIKQRLLDVFSIHYEIGNEQPRFAISWNPAFEPESDYGYNEEGEVVFIEVDVPDDNNFIHIQRLGDGSYVLAS